MWKLLYNFKRKRKTKIISALRSITNIIYIIFYLFGSLNYISVSDKNKKKNTLYKNQKKKKTNKSSLISFSMHTALKQRWRQKILLPASYAHDFCRRWYTLSCSSKDVVHRYIRWVASIWHNYMRFYLYSVDLVR